MSEHKSNDSGSTISSTINDDRCGIQAVSSIESGSSVEPGNILRDPYKGRGGDLRLGELTISDSVEHEDDYEDTIAYFGL